MQNENGMKLHVVVGYVTDWNATDAGSSLSLCIEGNDQGLRFLIGRLEEMIESTDGDGARIQIVGDEQPGLSVEPRSLRINLRKLPG